MLTILAVLAGACSSAGDDPEAEGGDTTAAASQNDGGAAPDPQASPARPSAQPAPAPAATTPEEPAVIATARGTVGGQPLTIEVNGFAVEGGDLLTLGFTLRTNQTDEFFNHPGAFREPYADAGDDYGGIYLVDTINDKKHLVMRDEADVCLCSEYKSFDGEAVLYATFPAPPSDVAEMTVHVPHFQPLRAVPITR